MGGPRARGPFGRPPGTWAATNRGRETDARRGAARSARSCPTPVEGPKTIRFHRAPRRRAAVHRARRASVARANERAGAGARLARGGRGARGSLGAWSGVRHWGALVIRLHAAGPVVVASWCCSRQGGARRRQTGRAGRRGSNAHGAPRAQRRGRSKRAGSRAHPIGARAARAAPARRTRSALPPGTRSTRSGRAPGVAPHPPPRAAAKQPVASPTFPARACPCQRPQAKQSREPTILRGPSRVAAS